MPVWVRGNELNEEQQKKVLAAFPYRWTADNPQRESAWAGVEKDDRPKLPLCSDQTWLQEHCFRFEKSGKNLTRNGHARPSYMAESGANPLTPTARFELLTFRVGQPGSFNGYQCMGKPGSELKRELAMTIARDRSEVDAKVAAAQSRGQPAPICVSTGRTIAYGDVFVDGGRKYWARHGLKVDPSTAFMLASGEFSFTEFEWSYPDNEQFVKRLYCARCGGTGNWSNKRPSKRKCSDCNGDGLTMYGRTYDYIGAKAILTAADIRFLVEQDAVDWDATSMLLTGLLHRIGPDSFVMGHVVASLYRNCFRPVWLEAPPERLATRDLDFIEDCCHGMGCEIAEEDAGRLLTYFRDRLVSLDDFTPQLLQERRKRGLDV